VGMGWWDVFRSGLSISTSVTTTGGVPIDLSGASGGYAMTWLRRRRGGVEGGVIDASTEPNPINHRPQSGSAEDTPAAMSSGRIASLFS
jgi:hypothetical protein